MLDERTLKQTVDTQLRLMDHLRVEEDLSLIVLKGHLVVEEILFNAVVSALKYPEALKSANLSFYKLACLAKALFYEDRHAPIWDTIFELNKLRNALAHNLELPDLDNRLRQFDRFAGGGNPKAGDVLAADPGCAMIVSITLICCALTDLISPRTSDGVA